MWPRIRMPLKTRDGVADAPIEPGLRTLCEPWLVGPRLKLWRLMVPAKPLPFEVPVTSTCSPGSNASTVTAVADGEARSSRANSSRCRCGPAPAFFRWPASGFVMRFALTAPNASWTAS